MWLYPYSRYVFLYRVIPIPFILIILLKIIEFFRFFNYFFSLYEIGKIIYILNLSKVSF